MRGSAFFTARNPRPAYGQDVLTLVQLRHYGRLFWQDRQYGVCGLYGGKAAFLRFLGDPYARHFTAKVLHEAPESEYLSRSQQRVLSRKVLQVLRGQVIFVGTPRGATWRPMLGAPEPPVPAALPFRDHSFRVEKTPVGPRIRRLQGGF